MEYVKLENEDGSVICVEIKSQQQRERNGAANKNDHVYKAETFMDTVSGFAKSIAGKLRECKASSVEVEFGLNFDINTGNVLSVIISGSTSASMVVKLTWEEADNK